ncbi:MAG: hypothetical protein P8175_08085 [Deltaproteobacteria bacterium]|jgi:hypothetical protein
MKKILLEPTLSKCVETLAKERYWSLVDEYGRRIGKEGALEDLEWEIETLRTFLEHMDVAQYRRLTEAHLEQGRKVRLVLEMTDEGVVHARVQA